MKPVIACLILSSLLVHSALGQNGSFMYDGITRDYILHLPPSYSTGNADFPLVINMHGYTSNAVQQQLYSQMDAVADQEDFIVVYPNGVANAWNVGIAGPYNGGVDDVGFLNALIDTLNNKYRIDLSRAYSTGMSNGGFMSYRLACELGDRIAAIASVTGGMTDSMVYYCNNAAPIPVMQIHGTADPTVPYDGGSFSKPIDSTIQFWVDNNSCGSGPQIDSIPNTSTTDNSTAVKYTYTSCNDSAIVVLFKIIGGGHTWPGAAIPIGVTNQDINGSMEIWKFFKQFSKGSPSSIEDVRSLPERFVVQNPVRDKLLLNLDGVDFENITIYDVFGRMLYHTPIQRQGIVTLPVPDLPQGLYIIQLSGAGGYWSEKVVVE